MMSTFVWATLMLVMQWDCTSDINYNGICDDQDVTVWDVISSNDSLLNAMDVAILAVGLDADLSTLAYPYYTVLL